MFGSRDGDRWIAAGRFPWWLGAVGGLFLVLAAALVATSLVERSPPTFAPTPPGSRPEPDSAGTLQVTLDARDSERWTYFGFAEGRVSTDAFDGWDLAARRFRVVVNGGGDLPGDARAARAGTGSLDSVRSPPDSGWRSTEARGGELRHPLLRDWYEYDFFSHLLRPRPRVYAIRTTGGDHVALRFVGYYCPGTIAGCVTFRYRFLSGPGTEEGDGTSGRSG